MKYSHLKDALAKVNLDNLQQKLIPFVSEKRLQKINQVINNRLNSLHLAIESPANINNAMAAIRTAESLGIYNIHIIAPEQDAHATRVITQGAFYWVNIHFYDNLEAFLETLKTEYQWPEQMQLAGAALADTSCALKEVPIDKPLCLLIGNEQRGLTDAAKEACQYCYLIPMAGMSQSFNLSVAAAISMYDTSERKRAKLKNLTDLTALEQKHLTTSYLLSSVDVRLAEQLIKD